MASQAEVDLVISTAGTLPQLERELEQIIQQAESGAGDIDVEATLDRQESVRNLIDGLNEAISSASSFVPAAQIEAQLDRVQALEDIHDALDDVIIAAELQAQAIELDAELDANIAALDAEIDALVAELEASAPEVDIEVDVDREGRGLASVTRLGRAFTSALPGIAKVGAGIFGAGLAAASAAPLLAGVATAVESIAPASAVAVTGLLAVQLATNTVKLAMIGVEDAVKAAFDPETTPEELEKSLKNLAPPARAFVVELSKMRKDLKAIQQDVQGRFFEGFDKSLKELGTTVLPVVAGALKRTATELNGMARGAASAASKLATEGTLGKALDGAVKGLGNLTTLPGIAVTALGQLGAAAAPAFDRITQAAARAGQSVGAKLSAAFESGALERAIDQAVSAIAQLGRVAGNVFEGLGNIISTVTGEGEGLFSIMEKVTKSFAEVTASKGFQQALKALTETAGVLVDEGLKLVVQALQLLGPVFEALGPPIQNLIRLLGSSLGRIFEKLGPVLEKLAQAFGKLLPVLEPFIVLATDILVAILPALIPLFETLGQIFEQIAPFAKQLAENIGAQLLPLLQKLAEEVLPALLPFFARLAEDIFPVLTEVLTELSPFLVKLGESLGELIVQLLPLIEAWLKLQFAIAEGLMPVIKPLIDLILLLVEGALAVLNSQIVNIIIPAIEILTLLLQGRFSEAWEKAKEAIADLAAKGASLLEDFANGAIRSMERLGRAVINQAEIMARGLVDNLRHGIETVTGDLETLPDRARNALGDLSQTLAQAGRDLLQGFINGIRSMLPDLEGIARKVADIASSVVQSTLGIHSPSTVMAEVGRDTMDGFLLGIAQRIPDLRSQLQGVANLAPSFALPDGQTLRLPNLSSQAPAVQVFIGNEQFNGHIDTRVAQSNQTRDRLTVTGVRR